MPRPARAEPIRTNVEGSGLGSAKSTDTPEKDAAPTLFEVKPMLTSIAAISIATAMGTKTVSVSPVWLEPVVLVSVALLLTKVPVGF